MNKEIAIELLNEFKDDLNLNIHMKSGSVIRLSGIDEVINRTGDLLVIITEDEGTFIVPASSIEFIHV